VRRIDEYAVSRQKIRRYTMAVDASNMCRQL